MNIIKQILLFLGAIMVTANEDCVPDWRAKELVQFYEELMTDGNVDRINDTLSLDFSTYSDSEAFVTPGITPVPGAAVIKDRAAFIAAYPPHPGAANILVTLEMFHVCNKIAFRWLIPGGLGGKHPIRGIDTLDLVKEDGKWKIKTDYSEFNNVPFSTGAQLPREPDLHHSRLSPSLETGSGNGEL